jgi:hypothetical protein
MKKNYFPIYFKSKNLKSKSLKNQHFLVNNKIVKIKYLLFDIPKDFYSI